ncbi:hypothetical protein B0H14DRAFT_3492027 [Mycena olivaceomarginata]|nr:hypothetical protein B0H14DRAFT_3492027 [Mycena olivaceomarginata]
MNARSIELYLSVYLMVADFVSADFKWLFGPKTGGRARVILRAGKNRDGYFTNDNILAQARVVLEILPEFGEDIEHVFVYGNATTHKKRAGAQVGLRAMPVATVSTGPYNG